MDGISLGNSEGHEVKDRTSVRSVDGDLRVERCGKAHESSRRTRVQSDGVSNDSVSLRPHRRGLDCLRCPVDQRDGGTGCLLGWDDLGAGGQGCGHGGDLA